MLGKLPHIISQLSGSALRNLTYILERSTP